VCINNGGFRRARCQYDVFASSVADKLQKPAVPLSLDPLEATPLSKPYYCLYHPRYPFRRSQDPSCPLTRFPPSNMTYTIVLFITRNHDLTSEEFRDHYEHTHIPLAHSLLASCWPIDFKRRYLARISRKGFGGPANPDRPPLMLRGEMNELDCDCIAEMTFDSEARFQEFYRRIYAPENAAKLARDEEKFLETGKTRVIVVGETWSTDEHGVSTREIGYIRKDERSDSEASGSGQS